GTPMVAAGDSLLDAGERVAGHEPDGTVHLPARPGELVAYGPDDGFPDRINIRRGILQDRQGTIWFGTEGTTVFDGLRFSTIGVAQGFGSEAYAPLLEDPAGNLWLGGNTTGVVRIARCGLVAYDDHDGLDSVHVMGVGEDAAGALYVTTIGD